MLALNDPLTTDAFWQTVIDYVFLGFYTLEMLLKILGMGFIMGRKAYLRDYWNLLDFVIVVTAYIPIFFTSSNINLKPLRSLRVLRPLRTISSVKSLRNVVATLLTALPMLVDSLFILFFVLFVFAIAGVQLFAGHLKRRCFDPVSGRVYINDAGSDMICGWRDCPAGYACGKTTYNPENDLSSFDTFGHSLTVIFQIISLEGWSVVLYEVMYSFTPLAVIYFVLLIFVASYFLLNITLAVIKAVFSMNARSKGGPKEFDYDQTLKARMRKAHVNIITVVKKYKEDRALVSDYYEIKANGQLKEYIPEGLRLFRKITSSAPIASCTRVVKKILCCCCKRKNDDENNFGGLTATQKDETDSPSKFVDISSPAPNLYTSEQQQQPHHHPRFTDEDENVRQEARQLKRFITNAQLPKRETFETKQTVNFAYTMKNTIINGGTTLCDIKDEPLHDEAQPNSHVEAKEEVKRKLSENEIPVQQETTDSSSPIRPRVSKFLMLKPDKGKDSFSLIGIAGIAKTSSVSPEKVKLNPEDFSKDPKPAASKGFFSLFEKGFRLWAGPPRKKKVLNLSLTKKSSILDETKRQLNLQRTHSIQEDSLIANSITPRSQNKLERKQTNHEVSMISDTGSKVGSHVFYSRSNTRNMTKMMTRKATYAKKRTTYVASRTLSKIPGTVTSLDQKEPRSGAVVQEEEEDPIENFYEDKFYIDIRKRKLVPARYRHYVSESYEAVLPKVFQRIRDETLRKKTELINKARPIMQYPMMHARVKKTSAPNEGESPEKSRAGSMHSTIPIRKRMGGSGGAQPGSQDISTKILLKGPRESSSASPLKLPVSDVPRLSTPAAPRLSASTAGKRSSALRAFEGAAQSLNQQGQKEKKKLVFQTGILKEVSAAQLGLEEDVRLNLETIQKKIHEPVVEIDPKAVNDELKSYNVSEKYLKLRVKTPFCRS